LHLLEKDIPSNEEEFNDPQIGYLVTHEEASQETWEIWKKNSKSGLSSS